MDIKNLTDRDFWTWLTGFIDGEACFAMHFSGGQSKAYTADFILTLRADDKPVLEFIQRHTGLGYLRGITTYRSPQISWTVTGLADCIALRDGLKSSVGLQSKKARDFALWSKALDLISKYGGGKKSGAVEELADLKQQLHDVKLYSEDRAEGWKELNGRKSTPRESAERPKGVYQAKAAKRFWNSEKGSSERKRRAKAYAKLEQCEIDDIVWRVGLGARRKTLAQEYGISLSAVSKYMLGKYIRR